MSDGLTIRSKPKSISCVVDTINLFLEGILIDVSFSFCKYGKGKSLEARTNFEDEASHFGEPLTKSTTPQDHTSLDSPSYDTIAPESISGAANSTIVGLLTPERDLAFALLVHWVLQMKPSGDGNDVPCAH